MESDAKQSEAMMPSNRVNRLNSRILRFHKKAIAYGAIAHSSHNANADS
jgi:hypothetical protein